MYIIIPRFESGKPVFAFMQAVETLEKAKEIVRQKDLEFFGGTTAIVKMEKWKNGVLNSEELLFAEDLI